MGSWTATAQGLVAQNRMDLRDAQRVTWLEAFAIQIGNQDRHLGNMSCFFEQGRVGSLSPAYDMLPMQYWPIQGEVFFPPLHIPATLPPSWRDSLPYALSFWEKTSQCRAISEDFRQIASQNKQILS